MTRTIKDDCHSIDGGNEDNLWRSVDGQIFARKCGGSAWSWSTTHSRWARVTPFSIALLYWEKKMIQCSALEFLILTGLDYYDNLPPLSSSKRGAK